MLVAGLALAGLWYGFGTEERASGGPGSGSTAGTESRPTVAVLPFENLSDTEEAEPFVRGLHSELLTRLSNLDGVCVVSRTAVLSFGKSGPGLSVLADSLGAEWIGEGGVQRTGDRIQVNAQLIDPATDLQAWAAN